MIDQHIWSSVRNERPIVHTISNIVTANDSANILLAIGASPIMADEPKEMKDITEVSHATVINIGTPNDRLFEASYIAAKKANKLKQPLVIDPVGVGASQYRKEEMLQLLKEIKPTIIRGNLGELQTLVGQEGKARGVDSEEDEFKNSKITAQNLAKQFDCTVLLTGAKDYITDGNVSYSISGGNQRMQQITGTGCMLTVWCGALAAVTTPLEAALNASFAWKACGEVAGKNSKGIGQMHASLFDSAEQLPHILKETKQVEFKEEDI